MASVLPSREQLLAENEQLRLRLQEAEETLRAIRSGEVDALVVSGPQGDQIFTLHGAQEPYRMLVEEMNQGAASLGADGVILFCNRRLGELANLPLEQITGQSFEALVALSDRPVFAALFQKAIREGRSASEMINLIGQHRRVPVQLSLSCLPADAGAAVALVATDMTETRSREIAILNMLEDLVKAREALCASETTARQRAEQLAVLNEDLEEHVRERTVQLETANRELEAFSYSVSHDLRAPLRYINGYVDRLRKTLGQELPGKANHYLAQITGSALEMGQLIDNLLVFSRMGTAQMRREQVDMHGLLEEVIQQLHPDIKGRKINWQKAGLPIVTADRDMLRQVLLNLLSNALKYTRPRALAEIEIGQGQSVEGEAVFFVRDNGVGFDMKYADKLFGVFQRLHAPEDFEGTGIGLANVRRIVSRHGGRTWAEGTLDGGATFYFSLPVLSNNSSNEHV